MTTPNTLNMYFVFGAFTNEKKSAGINLYLEEESKRFFLEEWVISKPDETTVHEIHMQINQLTLAGRSLKDADVKAILEIKRLEEWDILKLNGTKEYEVHIHENKSAVIKRAQYTNPYKI